MKQTGLFRLWYIAYDYAGNFYRWGYATSPDGIAWTKPNLGVERYAERARHEPAPARPASGKRHAFDRPRSATGNAGRSSLPGRALHVRRRIRLLLAGRHRLEGASVEPVVVRSFGHHSRHVGRAAQSLHAYYKLWELAGTEITAAGEEKPFLAYMPTFTQHKAPGRQGVVRGSGHSFQAERRGRGEERKVRACAPSTRGKTTAAALRCPARGPPSACRHGRESDDGIHWTNEQVVLRADDEGSAHGEHSISCSSFRTAATTSAFSRCTMKAAISAFNWPAAQTVSSGIDPRANRGSTSGRRARSIAAWFWARPTRSSASEKCGSPTAVFRFVTTRRKPIGKSAIGLATMRLDGFAAWEAGDETGELVTQPFRCNGDRLFVNADAHNGSISRGSAR